MGILKILKNSKFQLAIVFSVLIISYIKTIEQNKTHKNLVEKDFQTTGVIIDQYTIGFHTSKQVKFSYIINNKTYTKSVSYGRSFVGCERTRECIGRKFTVYYDIDNPENVFIDFDDEIGGGVR